MPSVRESFQPEFQPHNAQPETHGIQTIRMRPLRQGLPAQGGPEAAQRDAARPQMNSSHNKNFITRTFRNTKLEYVGLYHREPVISYGNQASRMRLFQWRFKAGLNSLGWIWTQNIDTPAPNRCSSKRSSRKSAPLQRAVFVVSGE